MYGTGRFFFCFIGKTLFYFSRRIGEGGKSHAGDQCERIGEDIPGKAKGKGNAGQCAGDPAAADGGGQSGKRGFLRSGRGRDAGVYRAKRRWEEYHDQDADRDPLSGRRTGGGIGHRSGEAAQAAGLSDRDGIRAEGAALDAPDTL